MFKAASFKIHNPSRHLATILTYALTAYHNTLRSVLDAAVHDPNFIAEISGEDKKGHQRIQPGRLDKYLRKITPSNLPISPLRDHLIKDASAMLRSWLSKREKGDEKANPPTLRELTAASQDEIMRATQDFVSRHEPEITPKQQADIEKHRADGQTRVARRLESIFKSRAESKAAGALLRQTEIPLPIPLFTDRSEAGRGFLLARKGENYYLLVRLFSEGSRYYRKGFCLPEFTDLRTGEDLTGKKYPGLILPLELGRDYHEKEFFAYGTPKSVKLFSRRAEQGEIEFYINLSFEFKPAAVTTETFLGIDRGAAIIGAASVIGKDRKVLERLVLPGAAFSEEMRKHREWIAKQQSKGNHKHRRFRVRGRRAKIMLGEFANRVIELAVKFKSQIVLEDLSGRAMSSVLTQSQVTKLHSMLEYKAERMGLPKPVTVPAAYTSQTCLCGHKAKENRQSQESFRCVLCGYEANADVNASEIIALRGLHQLTTGDGRKFQKFEVFRTWLTPSTAAFAAGTGL